MPPHRPQPPHLRPLETLRCLYEGRIGTIVARTECRRFSLTKGTKQGNPINSQISNAVLEKTLAQVKDRWVDKGWGIKVGPCKDDRLLNLRFADDLLLVSRSLKVLKKIMVELRRAVGEVGLELHVGKTTILSNAQGRKQSHATSVDLEEQRY